MANAFLLPLAHLLGPLQALAAWFAPRPAPAPCVPRPVRVQRAAARLPSRPLRVVRVVEPSAPRAIAGRMVISGRLADVCAELDRLAAQETASAGRR